MDGQRAFECLSKMTEDERKAVRLIWLDKEMLENLHGDDYEEKREFFLGLPHEAQGQIIENAIYPNGEFTRWMDAWLDDLNFRFEIEIDKWMEDKRDQENKQQQGENDR